MTEHERTVSCFGGQVLLRTSGEHPFGRHAPVALLLAEALLRRIHDTMSCFEPGSELSRLNGDPRELVEVSPLLARLLAAVRPAGLLSGGLVDATVEPGRPAGVGGRRRSVALSADRRAVRRPPGVRIDSGGLAKGLAADLVAERFAGHDSWVVECMGDLRAGGTAGLPRPVLVADPFGGPDPLDVLELRDGAIATSGTTRRAGGLLDPRDGLPAHSGIVQATALAPTGVEAEMRAKAALLAGPALAARHLPHGGVLVLEDRTVVRVAPGAASPPPAGEPVPPRAVAAVRAAPAAEPGPARAPATARAPRAAFHPTPAAA